MKATDPRMSTPSDVHPFATIDIFGLPFIDAPNEELIAEHLLAADPVRIAEHKLPLVFTPNVDIVVQLERVKSSGLGQRLADAAFVLPDGAPVVWTSRWAGTPLRARLAGSTVFSLLWPRLVEQQRRVFVFCSSEQVKAGLEAEYPNAAVVVAPMIDTSAEAIEAAGKAVVAGAVEAGAEFCMICIGHPKDPMVALSVIDQWPADVPVPITLCLGASAELHLGIKKRAPEWAQRHGLEWLVRFAQEPRRMFTRYFVRDLGFVPLAFQAAMRARRS